jgi:hypothetical protein
LSYQITLANGGGATVSGLRSSCFVNNVSGLGGCQADIEIYGMTLSQMNSLTTLAAEQRQSWKPRIGRWLIFGCSTKATVRLSDLA